jgi:hypothetical protein
VRTGGLRYETFAGAPEEAGRVVMLRAENARRLQYLTTTASGNSSSGKQNLDSRADDRHPLTGLGIRNSRYQTLFGGLRFAGLDKRRSHLRGIPLNHVHNCLKMETRVDRGFFSRALAFSPVRMADQTARPEELPARARKGRGEPKDAPQEILSETGEDRPCFVPGQTNIKHRDH